jgi:hypothetical protein
VSDTTATPAFISPWLAAALGDHPNIPEGPSPTSEKKTADENTATKQRQIARDQALMGLIRTAGVFAGGALGQAIGGRDSYANTGAQLGGFLGNTGVALGAFGAVSGPVGAAIAAGGSILGGVLGGLFGHAKPQQFNSLELIERNTRETVTAINNQSRLLDPGSRFFNVPSTFTTPAFRPDNTTGGAQVVNIVIHDARDPDRVAKAVAAELRSSSRSAGNYVDIRR